MGFVDERRKVVITLADGIWEFKALDGSVISKPDSADEKLTAALSETAKQQELVSGVNSAKLTVDGKEYDLEIERILDLRVGEVLEETAKLYPDQEISVIGWDNLDWAVCQAKEQNLYPPNRTARATYQMEDGFMVFGDTDGYGTKNYGDKLYSILTR